MSIRVEQFDGGDFLYIALDPDGIWARSEFPDNLITVDYNAQGTVIGIEAIGSAAQRGARALLEALAELDGLEDPEAVRTALRPIGV